MPSGYPGTKRTYNCLYCGNEKFWSHSTTNKFCNNICSTKYIWENVTKPKIEKGLVGAGSPSIRRFLIERDGEKCGDCGQLPIWNNKPLVLHMDHIDGDSDNNWPKNLRLLCPNCHTQSENFGSKGQGSRYKKISKRNKYLQEYKASVV